MGRADTGLRGDISYFNANATGLLEPPLVLITLLSVSGSDLLGDRDQFPRSVVGFRLFHPPRIAPRLFSRFLQYSRWKWEQKGGRESRCGPH